MSFISVVSSSLLPRPIECSKGTVVESVDYLPCTPGRDATYECRYVDQVNRKGLQGLLVGDHFFSGIDIVASPTWLHDSQDVGNPRLLVEHGRVVGQLNSQDAQDLAIP